MNYLKNYYLYILQCRNKSYYIGIAKDPTARLREHNSGKGSKYVKAHRPATLKYITGPFDKSEALKLEYQLKQLSHDEKQNIIDKGIDFYLNKL